MSRQLLLEHKRALVSREIQDDLALEKEIYRVLGNPRDIDYICANNKQHFNQIDNNLVSIKAGEFESLSSCMKTQDVKMIKYTKGRTSHY